MRSGREASARTAGALAGRAPWLRTMSRAARATTAIGAVAITAASALPAAYLGVVTLAGAVPPRRHRPSHDARHRFAVFIPAHNEQAIIADTLASLDATDYPRDRFEVYVVADNCADETAAIVRRAGWQVRERHDTASPGKGPALNWLYAQLVADGDPFDAVVVVDADTLVDAAFLREMDRALSNGVRVAQGYYSVRAVERSSAASLRYAALACRHRLRPLGRTRLGGSAGLYGNGMMFERSVLAELPWTGHLVEDAQMQIELLLRDMPVAFVPGAIVRAEMPDTLDGSVTQHRRWEQGRIEMARRYLPSLVRRLADRGTAKRGAVADTALDLVVPPLSVVVTVQFVATMLTGVLSLVGDRRTRGVARLAAAGNATALGITGVHVMVGLVTAGAPRHVYASLLDAPRAILWKLGIISRLVRRDHDVTWQRTARNAETAVVGGER